MKGRDIGALIIGLGIMIIVMLYLLPFLGISMYNPFVPSIDVYVEINPVCALIGCAFDEDTTTVSFRYPGGLSTIAVFSETFPTQPPEQRGQIPLSEGKRPPSLAWIQNCYFTGGKGINIAIKFKIIELNIDQLKPYTGFNWCGDGTFIQTFRFNYERGNTYRWIVEVWDMDAERPLYLMEGTQYLG